MRQAHSNNIPVAFEYIGLGQWAIRWDVQVDTSKPEEGITCYVYNEEIYNEPPTYGAFVSNRIRDFYTRDEEDALKSNMITATITPESSRTVEVLTEWSTFEEVRNKAKEFGRQIFNIE